MKKLIYVIALFTSVMNAQVGIGTSTPSGALEVNSAMPLPSTQKAGFVPPTVALSATNSTVTTTAGVSVINPLTNGVPTTGTIVYNTNTSAAGANQVTPGYYFYNGTNWEKFSTDKKLVSLNLYGSTATNAINQAYNLGFGGWRLNGWSSTGNIQKQYATTSGSGTYYTPINTTLTNLSLNGYIYNQNNNAVDVTIYIVKYSLGTTADNYTNNVSGTELGSQTFSFTNTTTSQFPVSISVPSVDLLAGDIISCWVLRTSANGSNSRTLIFNGQLEFYK